MAILSVTAANVSIGAASGTNVTRTLPVTAGEAITHGMPVYYNSTDSKYYKCDADAAATAVCAGISITSAAADGDALIIATSGLVKVGATLTVGTAYYVATTAGGIDVEGALSSGDYVTFLGVATTSALLLLDISVSGTAKP